MMGCSPSDTECKDDEKPAHQVTITNGFWLGQTEVTVGAYKRFAAATGRQMPPEPVHEGRPLNLGWGNDAMPIVEVTWDDAQAYCGWAGGMLPTEAEWEYAARAGSSKALHGPIDRVAWDNVNSGVKQHEVARNRANAFGLYDMSANVWEWVDDWYYHYYYDLSAPIQDPTGPAGGEQRVLRGGALGTPSNLRVSSRYSYPPGSTNYDISFRCGAEVFDPLAFSLEP
jgi:formylglycine-generating enzyme required for sulfatase activity